MITLLKINILSKLVTQKLQIMLKKLCFLVLLFISFNALAQVTNEGTPASWDVIEKSNTRSNRLSALKAVELPAIDIKKVRNEDLTNDKIRTKPFRVGIMRKVNFGLTKGGMWSQLPNGDRIWKILFSSKDALNLSVVFDEFYLPKGAKIYLYNDDKSDLLGAYTENNNNKEKSLGTWLVNGDKLWIEYFEPAEVKGEGVLNISHVNHSYRFGHKYQKGYYNDDKADEFFGSSGNCNHDVDCSIGADFEDQRDLLKKSVAFMFMPIPNSNSVGICTGTLVNNTSQDKKPYFLTANHCAGSPTNLYTMRFNWVSPNPVCGSSDNSTNSTTNFTINGATLKAQNSNSDFMLLELNSSIPDTWDVTYAGWDKSDTNPLFVVGIHHPQGDIMKICRDNSGVIKVPHSISGSPVAQTWEITTAGGGWELGVTEGGSSGSALFDDNGRIIGQLFGGAASCFGTNDNGALDFYGRFAQSWDAGNSTATRLKEWLDPGNSNPNTLDALQNVLAVNDEFLEENITVYPNPTSGQVTVKTSGLVGELSYEVFNILGQLLKSDTLQNESIQLNNLSSNIYFIKITEVDTNKSLVKKIVLSK
jgi:lysyl endopeptidase